MLLLARLSTIHNEVVAKETETPVERGTTCAHENSSPRDTRNLRLSTTHRGRAYRRHVVCFGPAGRRKKKRPTLGTIPRTFPRNYSKNGLAQCHANILQPAKGPYGLLPLPPPHGSLSSTSRDFRQKSNKIDLGG